MPAPLTFEHYEVLTREDGSLHELGRGAMGITYKGFDTMLRVPVALKVVNAVYLESDSARQRFVREARAAAQLRHRNVASVFHLGEEGGNYFYVMEFIDGETVDALVKRQGPLEPAFALRVAAQVARALNAAQAQGLVHRDIKPTNLMAVVEDDDLVIKVIDFGLATALLGENFPTSAALTHGGIVGTPHFASPEQLDEREVDSRSDIYSLGITLWYLLRGTTPFHGPLARVIAQHLSVPPPFEELDAFPEAVVYLLRRMLAKEPAARPQDPAELRKEIEQCLSLLAQPVRTRPASSATAPPVPFVAASDDARLETGVTLAQRYLITQELDENEAGMSFVARDLRQSGEVRLLALHRELLADHDSFAQIERESVTVASLAHPNVLEVFGLTTSGSNSFLTLGWMKGFTLRELLRARRELPPAEVYQLLAPAAAGLDHAIAHLPRLELGLHHVLVHFPGPGVAPDNLLPRSIPQWPEFEVKINPLATWREIFALTWATGHTVIETIGRQERKAASSRAAAIRAFGAIAYELLGGISAGLPARDYSPLAELDEAGNTVLRRVLVAPESFASASDFVQQLAAPNAGVLDSIPPAPPAPVASLRAAEPVAEPPETSEDAGRPVDMEEPLAIPRQHRSVLIPLAILLMASTASYLIFRAQHRAENPPLTLATPPPATTPEPVQPLLPVTPAATPSSLTRLTTPLPSTPSPPPSPSPPSRRDLANAARQTAEIFEARQQSREALAAWLRMAREYPEFDTGRLGVEFLLGQLRRRPGGVTRTEFASMQSEIRECAKIGSISAMLILGEALRESDPKQAFAWFCAAAKGGDPLAMTQAGLMLTNGAGTPRDLVKAVAYFQAAADQGDPAAMNVLAECYLDGDGVAKDPKRALALLRRASDRGNVRATNRLGWCYHKGIGVARDPREAFRLFSEAAEAGSAEALGNLGVLYLKGDGVEKNEVKAAEKLKEASLRGDLNSMSYYADCLDSGRGVKANADAAKKLFQKAAAAGQAEAIEWCKSRGVPFVRTP